MVLKKLCFFLSLSIIYINERFKYKLCFILIMSEKDRQALLYRLRNWQEIKETALRKIKEISEELEI